MGPSFSLDGLGPGFSIFGFLASKNYTPSHLPGEGSRARFRCAFGTIAKEVLQQRLMELTGCHGGSQLFEYGEALAHGGLAPHEVLAGTIGRIARSGDIVLVHQSLPVSEEAAKKAGKKQLA
jgi:hypothetical protein